jgi:hypothetical protein
MKFRIICIAVAVAMLGALLAQSASALTLYDGTIGDADPVTQGASSNIAGATDTTPVTGSFITPDAAGDFVRIERGSAETAAIGHSYNSFAAAVRPLMADDNYVFEADLKTGPANTLMHLDVISGASFNSGYRDRIFFEEDQVRLIGGLTPLSPFTTTTIAVGSSGSPWASMQDKNTFRFERAGLGFKMFANGTLVFNGFGASSGIGGTQINYTTTTPDSESDFYRLEFSEVIPEPASIALGLLGMIGLTALRRRECISC